MSNSKYIFKLSNFILPLAIFFSCSPRKTSPAYKPKEIPVKAEEKREYELPGAEPYKRFSIPIEKKEELERKAGSLRAELKIISFKLDSLRSLPSPPLSQIESLQREKNIIEEELNRFIQFLGLCGGNLEITSEPKGAKIYIDGEDKKCFTDKTFRVSCGEHEIRLEKPNVKYKDNPRKVNIKENETRREHFEAE